MAAACVLVFALAGCSSAGLVGAWENDEGFEFIFYDDGTLNIRERGNSEWAVYEVKGGEMIIRQEGGEFSVTYTIKGKTLTLTVEEYGSTLVFTKKPERKPVAGTW